MPANAPPADHQQADRVGQAVAEEIRRIRLQRDRAGEPADGGPDQELAGVDRDHQPQDLPIGDADEPCYADGNDRSLGLAEMAAGLRAERPHRASGEVADHVLEVDRGAGALGKGPGILRGASRVARPAPRAAGLEVGALA